MAILKFTQIQIFFPPQQIQVHIQIPAALHTPSLLLNHVLTVSIFHGRWSSVLPPTSRTDNCQT